MSAKRYTRARLEQILKRLVACSQGQGFASEAKRALTALLEARMSDVRIAEPVIRRLRADPTRIMRLAWIPAIAEVLRGDGPALDIQVRTLRVSAHDTFVEVDGPLGHLVALQMLTLLRLVGRQKIQRCDCGRQFVKIGKRRFCSERCQKRVFMRKFRADKTETE
jgi:hypothetical protein